MVGHKFFEVKIRIFAQLYIFLHDLINVSFRGTIGKGFAIWENFSHLYFNKKLAQALCRIV